MKSQHWLSNLVPLIQYIVKSVQAERDTIDALNVFPIPDGDTGTNVTLTLTATLSDISTLPSGSHEDDIIDKIGTSIIRHSRGNSGVILAGMILGATEALRSTKKPTVGFLARLLQSVDAGGRKAIMRPTEGTMITVARAMAAEATQLHHSGETSLEVAAEQIMKACNTATRATHRDMAAITGVDQIDSGAYAISVITRAIYEYATGKATQSAMSPTDPIATREAATDSDNLSWEPGSPLYCTEFISHPRQNLRRKPTGQTIIKYLQNIGNSVEYLATEDFAKIHVHTDAPHRVLAHFLSIGEISEVAVHNMRLQTEEHQRKLASTRQPPKPIGMVAVASGAGMHAIMRDLGADIVVDGGQTQNPTTGDIAEAINAVNAERVLVFPSNKNIILAATTASQIGNKPSAVIPTQNMPQTFNALLKLDEYTEGNAPDFGQLVKTLTAAALSPNIRIASIAIATKDYATKALLQVRQGQFIVIVGDEVALAIDGDANDAVVSAIRHLTTGIAKNQATINVYTDADYSHTPANLAEYLQSKIDIETNVLPGDQPIFHAIIEVVVNPT